MKILVITPYIPMPDRGSGELRLFSLLKILAAANKVTLYTWSWGQAVSDEAKLLYRENILNQGIAHESDGLRALLRRDHYDAIVFEWYYWVDWYLDDIKTWQPEAKIIIDTVDIEFRRLGLQAEATGEYSAKQLQQRKRQELKAYKRADMLIAVSAEERAILAGELPGKEIGIIPNIHSFPESLPPLSSEPAVIFIGNFRFDPNLDAVQYFCSEIWPAVRAQVPDAKFRIVGNALPEDLPLFKLPGIERVGYVPDTAPYLARSRVSVAPLRFGAGVKGKVGEAIAAGIPVITTSIGVQGMPLIPGEDILVGDTPRSFSDALLTLLCNIKACAEQRERAWKRLRAEFDFASVRNRVNEILDQVPQLRVTPLAPWRKLKCRAKWVIDREISWRFARSSKAMPSPNCPAESRVQSAREGGR